MALCGCGERMFVTRIENSGSSCGSPEVEESPRLAYPHRKENRDNVGARDIWSACNDGAWVRDICTILEPPIKVHVDGFGAALFDCVIDDTGSITVVDLE
eukprot:scaffold245771_cov71-Attheya_sp.AAC.4